MFPRTFFAVISWSKYPRFFHVALFDVISMFEKSTLFQLTFFDEISIGKNSMSFLVKLQANENIRGGFSLLITLKS